MQHRRWVTQVVVVVLIGTAIWYLQSGPSLPWETASPNQRQAGSDTGFVSFGSQGIKLGAAKGPAPTIGRAAPDFTLLDLAGTPVSLSDFRGNTVVMNFWATWCPPCRKEFPRLVQLATRHADQGLVVLAVDLQESPEIVRRFVDDFGASFPIVIDIEGDVAARYRLLGLPATFFIDSEGIVRGLHVGELTEAILTKQLSEMGLIVSLPLTEGGQQ
ncbi:MAG TPA: TlpA disulfide reductase family protein [Chloroflexota bacterium]|nr:TlpA disulfide reductase family protein [Chloroflexota bacterium]